MKEIEERLQNFQEVYDELVDKLEGFKGLKIELQVLLKKFSVLEHYYKNNWLKDVEQCRNNSLAIASQDAIWNLLENKDLFFKELLSVIDVKN